MPTRRTSKKLKGNQKIRDAAFDFFNTYIVNTHWELTIYWFKWY